MVLENCYLVCCVAVVGILRTNRRLCVLFLVEMVTSSFMEELFIQDFFLIEVCFRLCRSVAQSLFILVRHSTRSQDFWLLFSAVQLSALRYPLVGPGLRKSFNFLGAFIGF